jgi:hypothetical protein
LVDGWAYPGRVNLLPSDIVPGFLSCFKSTTLRYGVLKVEHFFSQELVDHLSIKETWPLGGIPCCKSCHTVPEKIRFTNLLCPLMKVAAFCGFSHPVVFQLSPKLSTTWRVSLEKQSWGAWTCFTACSLLRLRLMPGLLICPVWGDHWFKDLWSHGFLFVNRCLQDYFKLMIGTWQLLQINGAQ